MRKLAIGVALAMVLALAMVSPANASAASITVTDYRSNVQKGTTVNVTGRANGLRDVVLQRQVSGKWSDRGTVVHLASNGTFRTSFVATQYGAYILRFRSPGGSVVSASFRVQSWVTVVSVTGKGEGQTPKFSLPAGDYRVFATYYDHCYYSGYLEGSGDSYDFESIPSPSSEGPGSFSGIFNDLVGGIEYINMYADSSTGCRWSITLAK